MKNIVFIIIILILSSCILEESPVTPLDRGDLVSGYMENSVYDYSGYFSLSENRFVSYIEKGSWDIAFDCNGNFIKLNGERPVKASFVKSKDYDFLDEKYLPDSLYIDNADGDLTKSVMSTWWIDDTGMEVQTSDVLFINRGRDQRRRPLGIFKFQVIEWDEESFTVKFGRANSSESITKKIFKNSLYNFVYLNFDKPDDDLIIEPGKDEWDLVFAENSEYVPLNAIGQSEETDAIPYQVRGVYLNNNEVEAIEFLNENSKSFEEINRDDVIGIELSNKKNVIGYDWKSFSLQGEVYAVNPNRIYIIKDVNGLLYKFRFISFFSKTDGIRGFTSFEYQQL